MKRVLSAGVLLLVPCLLMMSHASGDVTPSPDGGDESPPAQINVERPGWPYDYGEYGVVMDERNGMVLACSAEGDPMPTYRWTYNGGALPVDPRISVEDGVLTIEAPTLADEGDYQCFASNTHGVALSSKYHTIYAFQENFAEVGKQYSTFTEGEQAVFECGPPDGAPKPRVYWTHAETNKDITLDDRIGMSDDGNLHFANTVPEDSGSYFCFAANDLLGNFMRSPIHEITITESLVVDIAATITSLNSSVTGLRTEEFKIKCLAGGFPTPEISWFRENNELPGSNSRISLESNNQELVFASLSFEDAGEYVCQAENGGNPAATKTVHLAVQSSPYFTAAPEDLILAPGESAEIECLPGGIPKPTREWLQNGQPMRNTESSIFEKNAAGDTISINSPRDGDSTVFQCVLENKFGQRVGSYTITILAIPATISEPPEVTDFVSEGNTLSLKCVAFGSPTPTIEWYRDDVKLVDGEFRASIALVDNLDKAPEYRGVIGSLNITDLVYDDGGLYECRALNTIGDSNAVLKITVRLPTSATMNPATLSVIRNNSADFTCEVTLDPRATDTITWYFNDNEIHPNIEGGEYYLMGKKTLRILSAKATHTGTFKCTSKTTYDEASATAELTVQAEPDAPSNVLLTIKGLEATLSWTQPDENNAEIASYTIEHRTQHATFPDYSDMAPWAVLRVVSSSSSTETIPLRNYLSYRFRVTATNKVGTSEKSDEVRGNMTAAAPPDGDSEPEHIRSAGSEPGKLTVSWERVHPFYQNGDNFEYVVQWWREGEEDNMEETIITDWRTDSFDINAGDYEIIKYTVGVRNDMDEGPKPDEETGTTGEGRPDAIPSNVQLVAISSNEINVTWDAISEEEVNGAIRTINIYYTMQSGQGSERVEKCSPDEDFCVLGNLQAFTTYEVAVAVENGYAEGDRSLAQTIKTEEGVPSATTIESLQSTSYRLAVSWNRPAQENGIHIGYHLTITQYDDDDAITESFAETVESPDTLSFKKEKDIVPDTRYEVSVTAYTSVGDGVPEKRNTRTGTAGKPHAPGVPVVHLIGTDFMNVTWEDTPAKQPRPDYVRACYRKEGDDTSEPQCTEKVDVLDSDRILIQDLEEGTPYIVFLEFENEDGKTKGADNNLDTTGKGEVADSGEPLTPWFIAIICVIIFLLLIILIVCILKSQKGGKYNVSDKEKQLKDESAPLKNNDGFAEFNQDSEFPDEEGSQDSLASHPEGSEGDSLKEYADDDDPSKFNEEGSFIEEYHDPATRSTDQRDGGTSTFV